MKARLTVSGGQEERLAVDSWRKTIHRYGYVGETVLHTIYICRIGVVVASLPSKQTAWVQIPYATVYMNLPSRGVDVLTKGSNF